ncbi:phage tail protein [Weissella cibaria]|uniref:phage tail protein n=1 Tax=Weissella cibaria TaxID=137591 RepID=UPI001CD79F46|nr:phage tail protein [Weissella cibaria]MCA1356450.1 phage tail protein [Weissella cibaria]MDQ2126373.1 phage tail protein [Weissella cibaria]MDQ2159006.1 phage tail protein [Weissella cibaria]
MLKFRDPQSNIQLAEAELTYKEAVNGEKSLTGTIYSNDEVLHQMERGWSVMFNGDWYYITYVAPTDGGNSITVEFDAVHEFFFKMSKSVAYGTLKDGSHTAKEYLDFVFNGSGYSYTLLSQVDAWEKQSFGDKNRLALFNDLISDMEMEFSIADSGRIMIASEIGQDLSTIVRKGFNLQELNLEYNVSDFVTYAKGFGALIDKDDESKGRYEAEYTSPLASVYGKLEADPITDERFTKTASLQAALKKAVDSSYSISVGISLQELQNAGYDYESPVPGDYILAVDEQLDFNQRIRIISVEEEYNVYGERISSSVEAGSLSATKQKLDGSESNSVVLALSHATEQADNAVKTANGKNTSYSGPNQPQSPREGDMWWYDNGSGTSFMKQYNNGDWVTLVDSNTKQNIKDAVDSAIETSNTYTDELNDKQVELTNELNDKVANGEALLKQEITDRENGDSVTLQAGKDFVTSQIKDYDTGMQSQISQVSDGIMASVSSTNLITDSSFVNATANWTLAGDVSWKIDNEIMLKGVRVATFNNGSTDFDRKTSTLKSTPIYTMNLGGTQFYASIDIYAQSFGTSAYMKAEIVQKNSSGTTTKTTAIGGSFDTAMSGWNTYTADITLDSATTQLYLQVTQYGGGKISVARPYLGSTKLNAGDYIPGSSTDNTSTLKLFNNFFAFGIQSNTGAIISGINGDSSGLNIVGKKITISGDTTFIGNNFMDGALIKNASIGTAQIADVSITNAKIASLDVNKISGNVSNFIQSNWNGKYGSTTINSTGMTVNSGGVITDFMNSGMKLTMAGESIGGIGVQGMTGKPNTYQGLTFWLDGNAEYMAWAARNNGDTSMNPVIQMSWYRSNSAPTGAYAGFNFDDDVIFNQGINVPGISKAKLGFTTKTFNGFNYPYFGDSRLQAGLAYGSGYTYLISGTTYYNLTRVIKALDNLGAVKIPSVINSDGTVKTWFNVTL